MEYAPGLLGKGAVGSFLDERMLKVVGRMGYLALLEHQPGRDEQVEGMPQLAVRHVDRGPYQLIGEFTPYRCPGLDNLLGWPNRSTRSMSNACRLSGIGNS